LTKLQKNWRVTLKIDLILSDEDLQLMQANLESENEMLTHINIRDFIEEDYEYECEIGDFDYGQVVAIEVEAGYPSDSD